MREDAAGIFTGAAMRSAGAAVVAGAGAGVAGGVELEVPLGDDAQPTSSAVAMAKTKGETFRMFGSLWLMGRGIGSEA